MGFVGGTPQELVAIRFPQEPSIVVVAVDVVAEPPPSKSMGFDGSSVATDGVGVETVPRRMLLEAQSMYSRYAPLPSRIKLQIGAGGRRGTVLITDPFFRAKVNLKREIMM